MKRIAWLLLLAPSLLAAQNPSDTGSATRHAEGRQRRDAWIRKELGLTEDQAAKLDATETRFAGQRRDLMKRQRAIFEALRGQLRPGIAANTDSVRQLLDARDQNRSAFVQLQRDEEKEMASYLPPVQRARYELLRERLRARFAGMRSRHGGMRERRGRGGWGGWHHRSPA